ncbi:MAG TPA: DUF2851 family protein [Bacteroidales bacterium]|nr:DUF2851 family protein [Bacteroidales bacterium]HXK90636.1 DUF2851 family protein [Bacteroidales bacterium]
MKEIKLHKWWARNYGHSYFKCNDDKIIKILNPGKYNLHDGPDYIGTVIETNGIKLIGNTEMHIFEQDYKRHNHLNDPHYSNVILHIFCFPSSDPILDIPFRLQIPIENISTNEIENNLMNISKNDLFIAGIARIKMIGKQLINDYGSNDLIQTLYVSYFRAMGLQANATAMVMLACQIPYKIFYDKYDIEDIINTYLYAANLETNLTNSTKNIIKKYNIVPIAQNIWNYKGVRPNAYPHIRIVKAVRSFNELINEDNFLKRLIKDGTEFWFNKMDNLLTNENKKQILANCILPLRLWYMENFGYYEITNSIITEGEKYKIEKNSLISDACQLLKINEFLLNLIHGQGILSLIKAGVINTDLEKYIIQ